MENEKFSKEAVKRVAEICGHTEEEAEQIIRDQEKKTQETVRLISAYEVIIALRDVLFDLMGNGAILIGPAITNGLVHELFDTEEGEE